MKVRLMFPQRDFSCPEEPDAHASALAADLELGRILSAMAAGDELILRVCRGALLSPLAEKEDICYRQAVLKDALNNEALVRELYDICLDTEERRRRSWYRLNSTRVSATFSGARELLNIFIYALRQIRDLADRAEGHFSSPGFLSLWEMLERELSDDYFAELKELMAELSSPGILISARFGPSLQGVSYTYRAKKNSGSPLRWLFAPSYTLAERDDAGAADFNSRRERALNEAADALARSAGHLGDFLDELKKELAFYMGALNLKAEISSLPLCLPELSPACEQRRSWQGLYDGALALLKKEGITGNDFQGQDSGLYVITGANQGGKTTFLRSIGQAQLMAQCGLFVFAGSFRAPLRSALYTHFKREEDKSMESGKLDEELRRMSDAARTLRPGDMMLFNESFASTTEREGSEIFMNITRALRDSGVEVFSVSHLSLYASACAGLEGCTYLRAERLPDGSRSFKILPGPPLETAYGEDIYNKIFGK